MQEQMDLAPQQVGEFGAGLAADFLDPLALVAKDNRALVVAGDQDLLVDFGAAVLRSEEPTSELQSLMRISYAVFCLKKQIHLSSLYPYIHHQSLISYLLSSQLHTSTMYTTV